MKTHGECKTPGGKLIVVEFDIGEGRLQGVVVTGDFFLYPEESLASLAESLEGAPSTLALAEYAHLVRSALTGDIELLGSSPEALATAVIRARDAFQDRVGYADD